MTSAEAYKGLSLFKGNEGTATTCIPAALPAITPALTNPDVTEVSVG